MAHCSTRDGVKKMVEYLAQALRQTSWEATILLSAPERDPHLQKIAELANLGFLHLQRAGCGQGPEGRGEDADSTGYFGGILMKWHHSSIWTDTSILELLDEAQSLSYT
jgi:hypothetical protein